MTKIYPTLIYLYCYVKNIKYCTKSLNNDCSHIDYTKELVERSRNNSDIYHITWIDQGIHDLLLQVIQISINSLYINTLQRKNEFSSAKSRVSINTLQRKKKPSSPNPAAAGFPTSSWVMFPVFQLLDLHPDLRWIWTWIWFWIWIWTRTLTIPQSKKDGCIVWFQAAPCMAMSYC